MEKISIKRRKKLGPEFDIEEVCVKKKNWSVGKRRMRRVSRSPLYLVNW